MRNRQRFGAADFEEWRDSCSSFRWMFTEAGGGDGIFTPADPETTSTTDPAFRGLPLNSVLPAGWPATVDKARAATKAAMQKVQGHPGVAKKLQRWLGAELKYPKTPELSPTGGMLMTPRAFRDGSALAFAECWHALKSVACGPARQGKRRGPKRRGTADGMAMRAVAALRANGERDWTQAMVSRTSGVSESQLCNRDADGEFYCRRFQAAWARQQQRVAAGRRDLFEHRTGVRSDSDPVARAIEAEEQGDAS